jgi:hypothetical protein
VYSVEPPLDVFVVYVDGISAVQLTNKQEYEEVILNVEPGKHVIDFSYQYNIFGVDPTTVPSSETRLGGFL